VWIVDGLCVICFAAMHGPLIVLCGVLIPSVFSTLFERCCAIRDRQHQVGFFRYPVSFLHLYAAVIWFVLLCFPPFLMLVQVTHTASGGWGFVPGFEYGILALLGIPFVMTTLGTRGFNSKREFAYWSDILNGKLDNHSVCAEDFIIASGLGRTLDAYLQERAQRESASLRQELYAQALPRELPPDRFSGAASGGSGGSGGPASSTNTLTQSEDRHVQLTLRSSRPRRTRTPQPKYPCDICGKLKTLRGCRLILTPLITEDATYRCNACTRKSAQWRIARRERRINEENASCNLKPQRRLTILPRQSENS